MFVGEHETFYAYYEGESIILDDKTWINCVFKDCAVKATKPVTFKGCVITGDNSAVDAITYKMIFGCPPPSGTISIPH